MNHQIEYCTKEDFSQIILDIEDFWGSSSTRTRPFHTLSFIKKNKDTSYVIKKNNSIVAYLFGTVDKKNQLAYVHLLGVRKSYQRQGYGRFLYNHFINYAKNFGCKTIKAVTAPSNHDSIEFHKKIGMKLLGIPNAENIPVVKDFLGPGEDRVVFEMNL